MYLGQVARYDITCAVNQPARAMFKPFKAHLAVVKHQLRHVAGTTDVSITYSQGDFKLTAFLDEQLQSNVFVPRHVLKRFCELRGATEEADSVVHDGS